MNTITTYYGVFATNKNGKTEFFNYYNFTTEREAQTAAVAWMDGSDK